MQAQAPKAFDISRESAATKNLYGIGREPTNAYGQKCLLARRLVERGVRFVQLFDTTADDLAPWDAHTNIATQHKACAQRTDLPIAGLLKDLKSRGLLQDTLVIWAGEFGRLPTAEGQGRDHNPSGFTIWLAGGGIKGGVTHGITDDFGFQVVQDSVSVHDLHATILHLLGLDHKKLTYRYGGRDFRLTDVHGKVIQKIIA